MVHEQFSAHSASLINESWDHSGCRHQERINHSDDNGAQNTPTASTALVKIQTVPLGLPPTCFLNVLTQHLHFKGALTVPSTS